MGLHLDDRDDGGFALYIDGDFQFDTADEAIYHESLALPALSLARANRPDDLRVLICGGGDGLALRECLRFPGVASVDLVDYDPTIVELARTRFAEINGHAFEDPRVTVHFRDAWEFVEGGGQPRACESRNAVNPPDRSNPTDNSDPNRQYDVILCDFTVPRTPEQTRIFTREWYALLSGALAPNGIMALNSVSPQITPEAFWCLNRTVRAAGLSALPYHVCIPSFRAHGYGAWAFILAANHPLSIKNLRALDCPVPTRQTDLTQLWRGARFRRAERSVERTVPVHSIENDCLLSLLLNPGMQPGRQADPLDSGPYSLDPLLRAIPISHPYHTRVMIETLAEQVASTVRQIDIRRLVDALLRRSSRLPETLKSELLRLREFLSHTTFRWERFMAWGARLFAALVILMTLANAIAPDNAFAKGSAGLGHASISRGYSGSFGGSRSIGGSASHSSSSFSGSSGRGSFGRTGAFGSHSIFSSSAAQPIRSTGFRSGYGSGMPVDVYGVEYHISPYRYYYGGTHSYFGTQNQSAPPSGPQTEHRPLFAADDDMLVMDNGDIIVTLSEGAYVLVANGTVVLRSNQSEEPLLALYADPAFFETIAGQLRDRQAAVQEAITVRRDWLSWVGWTSALLPAIAQDKTEMSHLTDLNRRLDEAIARMGQPPAGATPLPKINPGEVELFVDARLKEDGTVKLRQADGAWLMTDGKTLAPDAPAGAAAAAVPCPPAMTTALRSVIAKLKKEMTADVASNNNDLTQLLSDKTSLQKDLSEYENLQLANSGDPDYQVDYGTDEIPVSEAIRKTQREIDQTTQDMTQTQTERDKLIAEQKQLETAAQALRP